MGDRHAVVNRVAKSDGCGRVVDNADGFDRQLVISLLSQLIDKGALPAHRIQIRNGSDLDRRALECLLQRLDLFDLVLLDRDTSLRCLGQLEESQCAGSEKVNVFLNVLIVCCQVRFALNRVDNEQFDVFGLEILDVGRETGAAKSQHAGIPDEIKNFFPACFLIVKRFKRTYFFILVIIGNAQMLSLRHSRCHEFLNSCDCAGDRREKRQIEMVISLRDFCADLYFIANADTRLAGRIAIH